MVLGAYRTDASIAKQQGTPCASTGTPSSLRDTFASP
jgi:hypothetical protein